MGRTDGNYTSVRRQKDKRKRHSKIQGDKDTPRFVEVLKDQLSRLSASAFERRINGILEVPLYQLEAFITTARLHSQLQLKVLDLCLQRILRHPSFDVDNPPVPHKGQISTLRRLIFGNGDTMLIARTGWGKSLIFHAYTVLTGKTILQIIPLKKLGAEQMNDIRELGCVRVCLITEDSKKEQRNLIQQIRDGEYNHILLGPEQALSKDFKDILKNTSFLSKIGLVAIDEAHLIEQWKAFRSEFSSLHELRTLLPQSVIWFGCSATVEEQTLRGILNCGFRPIGRNPFQTEVIRTSVNRPDIKISVVILPRYQTTNIHNLYFLLNEAMSGPDTIPNPLDIPKTAVFVDSKRGCENAAQYFRQLIVNMTAHLPLGHRYGVGTADPRLDVFNIIQTFHANVAEVDKDKRYAEYKKPDSLHRILFATTSLGLGMNVPDITRVVIWGLPNRGESLSVQEAWQRAGRGARGRGQTAIVYFMFPYWLFDNEGSGDNPQPLPALEHQSQKRKRKNRKNYLVQKPKRSPLSMVQSATSDSEDDIVSGHLNETDSQLDDREDQDTPSLLVEGLQTEPGTQDGEEASSRMTSQEGNTTARRLWSQSDTKSRTNVYPPWRTICNPTKTKCYRLPILHLLGEDYLPLAERQSVPKEDCCNLCNPLLTPILTKPPAIPPPFKRPTLGYAGTATEILEEWLERQVDARTDPLGEWPEIPDLILPRELLWQLALLCHGTTGVPVSWFDTVDIDALNLRVPDIQQWERDNEMEASLLEQLRKLRSQVQLVHGRKQIERKEKNKAASLLGNMNGFQNDNNEELFTIVEEEHRARQLGPDNMAARSTPIRSIAPLLRRRNSGLSISTISSALSSSQSSLVSIPSSQSTAPNDLSATAISSSFISSASPPSTRRRYRPSTPVPSPSFQFPTIEDMNPELFSRLRTLSPAEREELRVRSREPDSPLADSCIVVDSQIRFPGSPGLDIDSQVLIPETQLELLEEVRTGDNTVIPDTRLLHPEVDSQSETETPSRRSGRKRRAPAIFEGQSPPRRAKKKLRALQEIDSNVGRHYKNVSTKARHSA